MWEFVFLHLLRVSVEYWNINKLCMHVLQLRPIITKAKRRVNLIRKTFLANDSAIIKFCGFRYAEIYC